VVLGLGGLLVAFNCVWDRASHLDLFWFPTPSAAQSTGQLYKSGAIPSTFENGLGSRIEAVTAVFGNLKYKLKSSVLGSISFTIDFALGNI